MLQGSNLDEVLSVAVSGKVALAMKGAALCHCESFRETEPFAAPPDERVARATSPKNLELLICTDFSRAAAASTSPRKRKRCSPS